MKKDAPRKEFQLDKINLEAIENLPSLILDSEKYYSDQVKEIIEEITKEGSTIKLLLIAGPSAAGKTTTSNLIRMELGMKSISSIVISLDDFFINREDTPKLPNGNYDYENITNIDLKYLNTFINDLLAKKHAKMPVYNFFTGRREELYNDVVINDNTMIIIEGLHAHNPKLINNHVNEVFRVYLALNTDFRINGDFLPAKDLRLIRRLTRDLYTRGYSIFDTLSQWTNVCHGEDIWIKPFRPNANYVINTVHKYEPLIYARYSKPLLAPLMEEKAYKDFVESQKDENLREQNDNLLKKARNIYLMLQKLEPLSKDVIPSSSLLWEFVGSAK